MSLNLLQNSPTGLRVLLESSLGDDRLPALEDILRQNWSKYLISIDRSQEFFNLETYYKKFSNILKNTSKLSETNARLSFSCYCTV